MSKWKGRKWVLVRKGPKKYGKNMICDISKVGESVITVTPVDDYFLHENNDITIGRGFHKNLLEKYSKKLRKYGEVESDINLTDLKSKFGLKIRPLNEGIDRIQDYIIEKSENLKTTGLKEVCTLILNILHFNSRFSIML